MSMRTISTKALALLFAAGTLCGACIVKEDEEPIDTGPVYKYPTSTAFCQALAEAECSQVIIDECASGDRNSCIGARSQLSVCNPLNLPYNPAEAEKGCLDVVKSIHTDGRLTRTELEDREEACRNVFSRRGAAGTSCQADHDCDTVSGLRCVMKPGQTQGLCVQPIEVSGGNDCSDPAAVCDENFYCNEDSYCIASPGLDKDCDELKPCQDGLKCEGGKCLAKLATNETCTADAECASTFCARPKTASEGVCTDDYEFDKLYQTCNGYSL